jgi:adenosylmethionine-8-amino-7-oxononanoate aminotransferase
MKKLKIQPFYNWENIKIKKSDGVYLYDQNNKKYIDLSASAAVVGIGYNNNEIKKEIKRQINKLIFSPQTCLTKEAEDLAKKIYKLLPKELNLILRAATGSEAVEIAMKIAVLYSRRKRFMSFDHAYHGQTITTLSLGNDELTRKKLNGMFSNIDIITPPYLIKSNDRIDEKSQIVLNVIEEHFKNNKYAAFITEGLLTSAGCLPFGKDFFPKLSKLCNKYGVLLIFDEVLTGFGRTGKMFSFEYFNIVPDIVCLSKGICSGYIPISAVATRDYIGKDIEYFSTYAWTPLACAIAKKNIDIILKKNLVKNSEKLGKHILNRIRKELSAELVDDVHGLGLCVGIQLSSLRDVNKIIDICKKKGVFLTKADLPNTLVIHPPLSIDKNVLDNAMDIVLNAIKKE